MRASGTKFLIVNADDFGYSPGVNDGILRAHEHGVVTSASVMVRWPAAAAATRVALEFPGLALGLHIDLGEWVYRDGAWARGYSVLPGEAHTDAQLAGEVQQQLEMFRRLVGQDPTHLDSHQHVHREEPLRSVLRCLATDLKVPLRHFSPGVRHVGEFHAHASNATPYPAGISVENLVRIIGQLTEGITEVGCHPGLGSDHFSAYAIEREAEVRSLCDPDVRAAVTAANVRLISFRDLQLL